MQTLGPKQSMNVPSAEIHHLGMEMKPANIHRSADHNEITLPNWKTPAFGSLKRPETQNDLKSSAHGRGHWSIRRTSRRGALRPRAMMCVGIKRRSSSFNSGRTPVARRTFIQIRTNWSAPSAVGPLRLVQSALHSSWTGISTTTEMSRTRRRRHSVQEWSRLGCQNPMPTKFGAR